MLHTPRLSLRTGVRCALTCALFAGGGDLHAQLFNGTLDVFVGTSEGVPLEGARVVIQGEGIGALTDGRGWARINGLPAGVRTVEVHYLGFAPEDAVVDLRADGTTTVHFHLGARPIALAPLTVTARRSILYSRGFYRRKASGQGTYLTRAEIVEMRPRLMSDVLRRIAGISVSTSFGDRSNVSIRGAGTPSGCPIQYYIDGTMTGVFNIDDIPPQVVEGMEIYRGAATIPTEFNKGRATCGVVVIWTRMW